MSRRQDATLGQDGQGGIVEQIVGRGGVSAVAYVAMAMDVGVRMVDVAFDLPSHSNSASPAFLMRILRTAGRSRMTKPKESKSPASYTSMPILASSSTTSSIHSPPGTSCQCTRTSPR